MVTKKHSTDLRINKIINQAEREISKFPKLLCHFEFTVSILESSSSAFAN